MRQIYEFWLGTRLLTSVQADDIADARMNAGDDANVERCRGLHEPAHEFRIRLNRADVRTRPLATDDEEG
jgi:hypothetical protein